MTSAPAARVLASLSAGLVAGTTNLIAAGAIFGGTLTHGLQQISSGLFGDAAFQGGTGSAAIGAGLHYFISIVAAALYCALALRWRWWRAHWLVGGTLFGVAAYLVMNLVVVPLSSAPNPDFAPVVIAKELVAHTVMFGIPIASIVSVWLRRVKAQ